METGIKWRGHEIAGGVQLRLFKSSTNAQLVVLNAKGRKGKREREGERQRDGFLRNMENQ